MSILSLVTKSIDDIAEEVGEEALSLKKVNAELVKGALSSNLFSFDLLLGGGFVGGRIYYLFGPESSGKSTIAAHAIARAIKSGKIFVVHCDSEGSSDPFYMKRIGLDIDSPLYRYFQPKSGESVYKIMLKTLNTILEEGHIAKGLEILFVMDSIAAMTSNKEEEKEGGGGLAMDAMMHSQYLRMIKSKLLQAGASILMINQIREKPMAWGISEYEPGGNAVTKFYPDAKIRIHRVGHLMAKKTITTEESGERTAKIVASSLKNKMFPSHLMVNMRMILGVGMSKPFDMFSSLQACGYLAIEKRTVTIEMPGKKVTTCSKKEVLDVMEENIQEYRKGMRLLIKSGQAQKDFLENFTTAMAVDKDE